MKLTPIPPISPYEGTSLGEPSQVELHVYDDFDIGTSLQARLEVRKLGRASSRLSINQAVVAGSRHQI